MNSVAVIIVNYKSGQHLHECLAALGKQITNPKKIVIIDNEGILDASELRDSCSININIFRLAKNIGFAAGNNLGSKACEDCKWIALVNPDAVPARNWLERLINATEKRPDVACFASHMFQERRREYLDGAGDAYHVSGFAWRRGYDTLATGSDYNQPVEVFSACAAAALYRRDAFEAVGGFDEDFFCYLEDVDLGFRLRLAGYHCLYVPEAIAYHVGSATTGKNSDFSVYHGHRNLIWTYVKNMPGSLFWLYLPQHIFLNIIAVVWYALQGRWRIILKAKWDAIKGLPGTWKKRKEIQSCRVVSKREIWRLMEKGWPHPRR